MQQQLENMLYTYNEFAILLSILINIGISIIGFMPSVFLTALNVKLFGVLGGIAMNGSLMGKVILVAVALGIFIYIWNMHKQKAKK